MQFGQSKCASEALTDARVNFRAGVLYVSNIQQAVVH